MKKVLVLTACLLSGLMAASVSEKKPDEAEVQRVVNQMGVIKGEIAGNKNMVELAEKYPDFRAIMTAKVPNHVEIKKQKILDDEAQLKALEEQLDKLLPKQ